MELDITVGLAGLAPIGGVAQPTGDTGVTIESGVQINGALASLLGGVTGTPLNPVVLGTGVLTTTSGATVTNHGAIVGASVSLPLANTTPSGVQLALGGSLTSDGSITGAVDGVLGQAVSTVSNSGAITGTLGDGVALTVGGEIDNTSAAASIRGGSAGVSISGGTATVDNLGAILGTGAMSAGASIGAGTLTNAATGAISGLLDGVDAAGAATLHNAGSILGTAGKGISLTAGGTVDNTSAAASINGGSVGISISGSPLPSSSAVDNLGTVAATGPAGIGVSLDTGTVTNEAGGSISGGSAGLGVSLSGSGTVVNAGTIDAPGGTAVSFGAGGSKLVLDAGQTLGGLATAAGTGNVLELAQGAGGAVNQLADIGTSIRGFADTLVDAGVAVAVAGGITSGTGGIETVTLANNASLSVGGPVGPGVTIDLSGTGDRLTFDPSLFSGTITGLGADDTLDLTGLAAGTSVSYGSGGLTITPASGAPTTIALGMPVGGLGLALGASGTDVVLSAAGTGTSLTLGATGGSGTGTGGTGATPPTLTTGGSGGDSGTTGSGESGATLPIPPTAIGLPTSDDTPTITGTAPGGATVTLHDSDGTTVLGTAAADPATGAYSITSSPLADGIHSLTLTDAVAGMTSAASAPVVYDIDTTGPQVTIDPTIDHFLINRTYLSGTVADAAGVKSVEIYADGKDVGSAAVEADGTWQFGYKAKHGVTSNFKAVATDGLGNASSTNASFDLISGLHGGAYTAVLENYSPTTGAFIGQTFFQGDGEVLYKDTIKDRPNGSATYTFSGGNFFGDKAYASFSETFDPNHAETVNVLNNRDGSHTIKGVVDGLTIGSIHDDTMTGGGSNETFVFKPRAGQELVTDFQLAGDGHDVLALGRTGLGDLAAVLANTTMSGNDAVIHVPNTSTTITLAGVTKDQLAANPQDFKFHP